MNKTFGTLMAVGLIVAGCGGTSDAESPKKFDAEGTFVLKQVAVGEGVGYERAGTGGYEDIHKGAQVVVTNAAGENVGLGELGLGRRDANGAWCEFPLTVSDIPVSKGIYSVDVSGRGKISFKRADAKTLALG